MTARSAAAPASPLPLPEAGSASLQTAGPAATPSLAVRAKASSALQPRRWRRTLALQPTASRALPERQQAFDAWALAVFAGLLYRYTARSELTLGVADEHGAGLVPLQLEVRPEQPFSALAAAVEQAWQRLSEQHPAEQHPTEQHPASTTTSGGTDGSAWAFGIALYSGAAGRECAVSDSGARELCLRVRPATSGLDLELGYDGAALEPAIVESLAQGFARIAAQVLEDDAVCIAELRALSAREEQLVLREFNDTAAEIDARTYHGLFELQAERVPEQLAVVDGERALTYAQLEQRANQLANRLIDRGVGRGSVVALFAERSVWSIVAMFGIMKAGAAYLPIEPSFPDERVGYMLRDSGCQLAVTTPDLAPRLPGAVGSIGCDEAELSSAPASRPSGRCGLRDLAYVIYTSGSTGQPKGVPIVHEGVANLHAIFRQKFAIDERDRMTEFASFAFDTSVWEIVMCLLAGATLHVLPESLKANYARLQAYLRQHEVTVATFPPPYLAYLEPEQVRSLRKVMVAGSECPAQLLRRWNQRVAFHNAYGPTEASVCIAVFDAPREAYGEDTVPIGRPLLNKRIYVVSEHGQLQPIGVTGELWVSGTGLSPGYLGQPELTAERFVPNPFRLPEDPDGAHQLAYRTGDLARWRRDGNLEFLGRRDNQVKVRGYRIELDEVDAALLRLRGVDQAGAVAVPDGAGDNVLYGFYTSAVGLSPAELRQALAGSVPDFSIPSQLIALERMPLTNSDKTDRKALAELARQRSSERAQPVIPAPASARAPALVPAPGQPGELEQHIERIVASASDGALVSGAIDPELKLDGLGINSLQFMKAVVQLEQAFSLEFDEDFLLEGRSMSIREIAALIRELAARS